MIVKKYKKIIIVCVVLVGLIIANKTLVKQEGFFLNNALSYVFKPLGTIFSTPAWWLQEKLLLFKNIGELKTENQRLFYDNLNLQSELAKLKDVSEQNKILREELKLAPREEYNLEPALVIGKSSGSNGEVIYINKGRREGIREHQAVLVGEGVLIGKVIGVTDNTAKIQLVIDNNFKVNAKTIESGGKGVVEGRFGTSALMKMIPQTVKLNKGDTIVTSELSAEIREGLLIGYIQDISTTSDNLFQEATVLFPVDFDKLHLVWVLK
jgi:rod shape-determining protein MreC